MKFIRWAFSESVIANLLRLTLVLAIILNVFTAVTSHDSADEKWLTVFVVFFALILTYIPSIITKRWGIYISRWTQLLIVAFIYSSMFLGEVLNYYEKYWWWDDALHATSGVILGIIGFSLVYTLNKHEEVGVQMSPIFIAFFAFTFAVASGAVWEIYEFLMDSMFNTNMQRWLEPTTCISPVNIGTVARGAGLIDTMSDIIIDTLSALMTSVIGYLQIKLKIRKISKK